MSSLKLSFYLIIISQGISSIGGTILRFAISLHVLDLTGSAEAFATMVAVAFLPMALFQPVGGALADRFNKKMLLVLSDSTNTWLTAFLAILLFGGSQSVFVLGAVVTLLTFVFTCYHPTVTASLPVILKPEELPNANGIIQGLKAIPGKLLSVRFYRADSGKSFVTYFRVDKYDFVKLCTKYGRHEVSLGTRIASLIVF